MHTLVMFGNIETPIVAISVNELGAPDLIARGSRSSRYRTLDEFFHAVVIAAAGSAPQPVLETDIRQGIRSDAMFYEGSVEPNRWWLQTVPDVRPGVD